MTQCQPHPPSPAQGPQQGPLGCRCSAPQAPWPWPRHGLVWLLGFLLCSLCSPAGWSHAEALPLAEALLLAEAQPFVRAASPSASFSTPQGSASSPGAAQNPEELFLGLARLCKPDWASRFRPPAPTTFASRAQNALTLGGVFADVLLAASAEDVQQSKNLSKDILALARPLGVQTELLDHSKSLVDCAERHDWGGLRREMETTRAELEGTLRKHADDDLIALLTLGAWMRATEVVASLVCERYSPETASLLRQPVAAQVVRERTASLSEKLQTDPTVTRIRSRLAELERLLAASLLGDINLKRN